MFIQSILTYAQFFIVKVVLTQYKLGTKSTSHIKRTREKVIKKVKR